MLHKWAYLLFTIGVATFVWFLSVSLGWSPGPVLSILWAAALAAAVILSGLALVLAGRRLSARVILLCGILVLAALILIPPIFHEHEPNPPQWLNSFPLAGFLLPQVLPYLALFVTALLLYTALNQIPIPQSPVSRLASNAGGRSQNGTGFAAVYLVLSVLVLTGGLYHIYWLFVWDSTYDPIDIFFLLFMFLPAVFSAARLAVLLPGSKKWAATLYLGLVPALIIVVFVSAKQVDFRQLTEARAERITQALETYYDSHGSYPETLDQLVPLTMLTIPSPVIMYGQDWCYQAKIDSYRLGYVNRDHWSSPILYSQVFNDQYTVSDSSSLCDPEITILKTRYRELYGIGY